MPTHRAECPLFLRHLLTVAKNILICNVKQRSVLWRALIAWSQIMQAVLLREYHSSSLTVQAEVRNNSLIESYFLCYCQKKITHSCLCYKLDKHSILKPFITYSSLSTPYSINTSVLSLTIYRILFSSVKSTCTIFL